MNYDLIVIGSGPGGYVTAIRASQLGLKTAIVEKESLGGICLNWGCIPTKALLKSAQVFEYINKASTYGIQVNGSNLDFVEVIKRSRDIANGMSKGIEYLMKKNKIDVIFGHGKITETGKVEVTSSGKKETYKSTHIILATGARSRVLPNIPQDGSKVIGYREAMTLKEIPKKLVIIGSGAIGVEFAYFYATMGSEVTIVEYQKNIVPIEDNDISKQLQRSFKKLGIKILTQTSVEKVDVKDKCIVHAKTKDSEQTIDCDVVLSAVGIEANIEGIGLEELGVSIENGRVIVDKFYRTNVPGIYAIGDMLPTQALAHVASAEGILCVEKITGHDVEPLNYSNIPGCTYCSPEIASVGLTEEKAKELGYEVKVGKFPFSASGKASAAGHKDGFVKVVFDAKYGEWLGCHMIGYNVTEMIAEAVVARRLETTGMEILKSVHPHPTMSEAVMEAVADAYDEVIHI
ncbi:dihydrolipoyl dehydrogenase [Bacteroidota bacterium]|nr:dihydrolipoyl dehydrogenase [Bacteroidota bacterium]MDC3115107.1 dihydrolipoyl dehydrogenase [Bacteroidota bacterium]